MHDDSTKQKTRKAFFTGTERTRAPEDTLAEYGRFMSQMGITRLANITGLDRIGLPVCIAVRPNSRTLATSQGKGETIAAAKTSALMESIEVWHAERVTGPLCYESYTALASRSSVIDVTGLAVRSDATFCPERPIYWIEGRDLVSMRPLWLPFETVSLNLVKQPGHKSLFLESSNGLASGNCVVEATIHALCEVIERDASALWECLPEERRKQRQVDLTTIDDPALRRVIDILDANDVVLGVWEITSDIGVPTYTCMIVEDPDGGDWRPVLPAAGHGTHLVPEIALSRAIHEAIQSRLTKISGSRDDIFPSEYLKFGDRAFHARAIARMRTPAAGLRFDPPRLPVSEFFEDDLETLLSQLRQAGLGPVALFDLTRPEIGIPVVKVVVPGLEPLHSPLYRPGPRAQRAMSEAGV